MLFNVTFSNSPETRRAERWRVETPEGSDGLGTAVRSPPPAIQGVRSQSLCSKGFKGFVISCVRLFNAFTIKTLESFFILDQLLMRNCLSNQHCIVKAVT